MKCRLCTTYTRPYNIRQVLYVLLGRLKSTLEATELLTMHVMKCHVTFTVYVKRALASFIVQISSDRNIIISDTRH